MQCCSTVCVFEFILIGSVSCFMTIDIDIDIELYLESSRMYMSLYQSWMQEKQTD